MRIHLLFSSLYPMAKLLEKLVGKVKIPFDHTYDQFGQIEIKLLRQLVGKFNLIGGKLINLPPNKR